MLHLDMSVVAARDPVVFEQNLGNLMRNKCAEFGVPYDPNVVAATNFEVLLTALREKSANGRYVLLTHNRRAQTRRFWYNGRRLAGSRSALAFARHAYWASVGNEQL